jgi:hypothetical protein
LTLQESGDAAHSAEFSIKDDVLKVNADAGVIQLRRADSAWYHAASVAEVAATRARVEQSAASAVSQLPETSGSVTLSGQIATPARPGGGFGCTLATDGDVIVIGALMDNAAGTDAGAAYVYRRDGVHWLLDAQLKPSHQDAGDRFGNKVSIDHGRVVVTASEEASRATQVDGDATDNSAVGRGAAYVFERIAGTWTQSAYLKTTSEQSQRDFGAAVDIADDVIAIGAPRESAPGLMHPDQYPTGDPRARSPAIQSPDARWAGAVHVFKKSVEGWREQARLTPTDHESGLEFGSQVEVDGDTIAVGSGYSEFMRGGHVYVFRYAKGKWTQQAHLTHPDRRNPDRSDRFGVGIALQGDTLAVGSHQANGPDSVFMYRRMHGRWQLRERVDGSALTAKDGFGARVAMDGGVLVAASPDDGGAYVLTRTAGKWTPLGFAATIPFYWAAIDYHAPTHTLVSMSRQGVSIFSIGEAAPSATVERRP